MLEQIVAKTAGIIISDGLLELYDVLRARTVVGIIVTPAVFKTKNVIMGVEATFLSGFIFCNSLIAFKPNGVAALPNPSILAAILEAIYPKAGFDSGTEENNLDNIGFNNLANLDKRPETSAIFIIPLHSTIIGIIDNINSKAFSPFIKMLLFRESKFPVNKEKQIPITIKKNQI